MNRRLRRLAAGFALLVLVPGLSAADDAKTATRRELERRDQQSEEFSLKKGQREYENYGEQQRRQVPLPGRAQSARDREALRQHLEAPKPPPPPSYPPLPLPGGPGSGVEPVAPQSGGK